jgi:major vault protein
MRAIADGEKKSGEQWIVRGPCRYVPPVEAEIVEERQAVILDVNEGIYVRDLIKGDVKLIRDNMNYML